MGIPALGAEVETLLMPGPLAEAHSEFETDCGQCHTKFDQSSQRSLCLDCHEDIANDLEKLNGLHGLSPSIKDVECTQCHREHLGRDADIIGIVTDLFDHSLTNFPLTGGHQQASCNQCHEQGDKYRDSSPICAECHAADEPHDGNLGQQCDNCHSQQAWSNIVFNHGENTEFDLTGAHATTSCSSCHANESYAATPSQCQDCHQNDDVHNGSRGDDCISCHNAEAWSNAKFDHQSETDFALQGSHADLTCSSCHLSSMSLPKPPSTCVGCHASVDTHQGQNGDGCEDCHTQTTWEVSFNHSSKTGFALTGAHSSASCNQCHKGALTDDIETACYACHVKEDPHAGELTNCEDCHGVSTWLQDITFHHDLTSFALLGGHQLASCEQCHNGLQFASQTGGQCVDCHGAADPHERSLGTDCSDCHSPVAWSLWSFDHEADTSFSLTGAHDGLECAACHTPYKKTVPPSSCAGCHRQDDPHRGSFGDNCLRCHSTDTFASPRMGRSQ